MKRIAAAAALTMLCGGAQAATASGHAALALGALVGLRSPALTHGQRTRLGRLLDGRAAPGPAVVVEADAAVCRAGDVDVAAFGCTLTFGPHLVSLGGRAAHELFATIAGAGVPGDGAAGTVFEALHALACTLDPTKIAAKDGSGADCAFEPGPP